MDERVEFFVGLDAHKHSIAVAACEAGRGPARFAGTMGPDVNGLLELLAKAGEPAQVSVVYEAGPTGYGDGLHRELCRRGDHSQIAAPSLIPRRAGERIKNDRRDCLRLAELSRAGELKAIWVPDEAHEAMRNLWRAREDAVGMRLKTRQQLQALLLRHGRRYPGKTNWTKSHERWIDRQRFEHDGYRIALAEYQLAAQAAEQRVDRLTTALMQAARGWRFEPIVAALRALRGIDTVCAIGLVTSKALGGNQRVQSEAASLTDRCTMVANPRTSVRSIVAAADLCRITPGHPARQQARPTTPTSIPAPRAGQSSPPDGLGGLARKTPPGPSPAT